MRKILLFFVVIIINLNVKSQTVYKDIVITNANDTIYCKITVVKDSAIYCIIPTGTNDSYFKIYHKVDIKTYKIYQAIADIKPKIENIDTNKSTPDAIITYDKKEIKCKIIEIGPEFVKYRNFDEKDGPIRNISKYQVFLIEYGDGKKEFFTYSDEPHRDKKNIVDYDGGFGLGVFFINSNDYSEYYGKPWLIVETSHAVWIKNFAPRFDFGLSFYIKYDDITVNYQKHHVKFICLDLPLSLSLLYRVYNDKNKLHKIIYPYFGLGVSLFYLEETLKYNDETIGSDKIVDLGMDFIVGMKVKFLYLEAKYSFGKTIDSENTVKNNYNIGGFSITTGFRF